MVVDNDDVELEVALLAEGRLNGVGYGLDAVEDGNHDRCLVLKLLLFEVGVEIFGGVYDGTNGVEVTCHSLLHLDLHLTVARVHIVELLGAAQTCVELDLCVKILVDVEQLALAAEEQTQVIETGKLVVDGGALCPLLHKVGLDENHLSEVEVVAQATPLVVDNRMLCGLAVGDGVMVRINHCCIGVVSHAEHTFKGIVAQLHLGGFEAQEHILGFCLTCNVEHRFG